MSHDMSVVGLDYICAETSQLDRSIKREEECCKIIQIKIGSLNEQIIGTRNEIAECKKKLQLSSRKVQLLETSLHDCFQAHSKVEELIRNYNQHIYDTNKELISKRNRYDSIILEYETKWKECKDVYDIIFQNSGLKALLVQIKKLKIERNKNTLELSIIENNIQKLNSFKEIKMRVKIVQLAKMKKITQELLYDKTVLLKKIEHLQTEINKANETLKELNPYSVPELSSKTKQLSDKMSECSHDRQDFARGKEMCSQFFSLKRPRLSSSQQELVPQLPEFDLLFSQQITHSSVATYLNKIQDSASESCDNSRMRAQHSGTTGTDATATIPSKCASPVNNKDCNAQLNDKATESNPQTNKALEHENIRDNISEKIFATQKRQENNSNYEEVYSKQNVLQEKHTKDKNNEMEHSSFSEIFQDDDLRRKQTPEMRYLHNIIQAGKESLINQDNDNPVRTKATNPVSGEDDTVYSNAENVLNEENSLGDFVEQMDTSYADNTHHNNGTMNNSEEIRSSNDGCNAAQAVQSEVHLSQGSVSSSDDGPCFSSSQVLEQNKTTIAQIKSKMSPEIHFKPQQLHAVQANSQKQQNNDGNQFEPHVPKGINKYSRREVAQAREGDPTRDTMTGKPAAHLDRPSYTFTENEAAEDTDVPLDDENQSQYFASGAQKAASPGAPESSRGDASSPPYCNVYEGMVCSPCESDYGDAYASLVLSPEEPSEASFPGLNFRQPSSTASLFGTDDRQQSKQGDTAAKEPGGFSFFTKSSNTSSLFSLF